ILQRKNAHGKEFDDDMFAHLNTILDAADKAYQVMLENIHKPYGQLRDISNARAAEDELNNLRNKFREEHVMAIEQGDYVYQIGVYYMDVVSEIERMGDVIINISEAAAERGRFYGLAPASMTVAKTQQRPAAVAATMPTDKDKGRYYLKSRRDE
ncbi:MAG: hypothetical protein LUC24_06575, partial [Bacteroidales bacterium]|nr:hypothetical protein [Bacteroidales bacterium]